MKMETRKLVRFDWAIKTILRNKANFSILEGFLSELLKTDVKIKELLESESNKENDWSIAEVLPHGAEPILRAYPSHKQKKESPWKLPPPLDMKLLVEDPERMKEILCLLD